MEVKRVMWGPTRIGCLGLHSSFLSNTMIMRVPFVLTFKKEIRRPQNKKGKKGTTGTPRHERWGVGENSGF